MFPTDSCSAATIDGDTCGARSVVGEPCPFQDQHHPVVGMEPYGPSRESWQRYQESARGAR